MKAYLRFAVRNVLRHRRRSALALAAIASGVAALILARGFIDWNLWQYRESAIKTQFGHIQVHRTGYLQAGLADPFAFLLPDTAADRSAMASMPHVRALAPRIHLSGLVSRGDSTLSFIGEGVDPVAEKELAEALVIVEGDNLSAEDPLGIVVGQGLAANLGISVGDAVVLLVNTKSGGINAVEVIVRGLFSTVVKAYDDAALRLPLATAYQLLRTGGAHSWMLLLDETRNTDEVLSALRQKFSAEAYEFVPWWELSDFYNKSAALLARQSQVMKVIIAVLIILSISNTLIMGVMERTGEIGTSMALGVPRAKIMLQFLCEGAVLGVVGGIAGAILGSALGQVVSAIGIPLPPPPGMARGFTGGIRVTAPLIADALALSILTTLLASIYPARKASRMEIVNALRHNR